MNFEELQHHVLLWAAQRGILAHSNPTAQFVKLAEEFGELAAGLAKHNPEQVEDSLGDMLVVMILFAELAKIEGGLPECLNQAYRIIKDRKGYLNSRGIFVKDEDTKGLSGLSLVDCSEGPCDTPAYRHSGKGANYGQHVSLAEGAGHD